MKSFFRDCQGLWKTRGHRGDKKDLK